MKSLRILLPLALLSISSMAFAQPDAHQHSAPSNAPKSDAQKSFDKLKTLAGTWEGHGTTNPPVPDMPDMMRINLDVTSSGNALKHEMMGKAKNANPKKDPDHPITM